MSSLLGPSKSYDTQVTVKACEPLVLLKNPSPSLLSLSLSLILIHFLSGKKCVTYKNTTLQQYIINVLYVKFLLPTFIYKQ